MAAGSINSVTLGGSAMTAGTQGNRTSVYARAFYLLYPTGTTADVAVTFGAATLSTNNHIAVYTVVGGTYSSTGADQTTDMDATDPLTTGSTTIGTGGGMIAVVSGGSGTGGAKTWSNLGEDLDADGGSFSFCTAFSTTAGTATRTCTGSVNDEDGAMSWLIFGANTSPTTALNSPADSATGVSTTPVLDFTGTDTESNDVRYEVQVHTDNTFLTPLIDAVSGTDAGFANPDNGGDTDPFTSAENIQYTVQSALSNSTVYYWRVRAIDPTGTNTYGAWATTRSFTTSSGSESYDRTASLATLTLTPQTPTESYLGVWSKTASLAQLTITPQDATGSFISVVSRTANLVELTLTPQDSAMSYIEAYSKTASLATLTLTPQTPTESYLSVWSKTASLAQLTLTPQTPTRTYIYEVSKTADLGTLTLTPQDTTMGYASAWSKTAALAQLLLTPQDATVDYLESAEYNRTASLAQLTLTPKNITSDSLVWWSTINQYNLILVDGDPAIKLANGLYNKV